MKAIVIAVALGVVPATAQAQELPAWMSGCWEMRDGDSWVDECWMSPRGGVMLGASRSGTGEGMTGWEATQITIEPGAVRKDSVPRMIFWASPNGNGRTPFEVAGSDAASVTFVNLTNDYPQRIHYWREGALLMAEISRADGSDAMRWTFEPMGGE